MSKNNFNAYAHNAMSHSSVLLTGMIALVVYEKY